MKGVIVVGQKVRPGRWRWLLCDSSVRPDILAQSAAKFTDPADALADGWARCEALGVRPMFYQLRAASWREIPKQTIPPSQRPWHRVNPPKLDDRTNVASDKTQAALNKMAALMSKFL